MPFGGLLTVGLIGAGAGVGSALIGAHASGKAADQQAAASEKALALQSHMYEQTRADTAPWRNTGGQAVQTLGGLMGLGGGGAGASAATPSLNLGQMYDPSTMPPRGSDPGGTRLDDNGKYVPINPSQSAPPPGVDWNQWQGQSSYGGNQMQMVKLKAPDGTIQSVPSSAVQHYLDMGAVRV